MNNGDPGCTHHWVDTERLIDSYLPDFFETHPRRTDGKYEVCIKCETSRFWEEVPLLAPKQEIVFEEGWLSTSQVSDLLKRTQNQIRNYARKGMVITRHEVIGGRNYLQFDKQSVSLLQEKLKDGPKPKFRI